MKMTPKGMAEMEHKKMKDKKCAPSGKAAPAKKSCPAPKKSGKR